MLEPYDKASRGQVTAIGISRVVLAAIPLLTMSKTTRAQSLPVDTDIPTAAACVSVDYRNNRRLAFGMRGRIQKLAVSIDDRVTPGTRLAQLECNGAEADLQIAVAELEVVRTEYGVKKGGAREGELAVAEARLRAAQVALQDAEATHTRLKKLAGNGGVVLQTELSEVARRWANAELDVAMAQSSVERIRNPLSEPEHEYWRRRQKAREAAVRRARLQVGYCDLRAPVAGVVDEVLHYEGEFVDGIEPVVVLRVEEAAETPSKGKDSSRRPVLEKSTER